MDETRWHLQDSVTFWNNIKVKENGVGEGSEIIAKWYRGLSWVWGVAIYCGALGNSDVAPFVAMALKTDVQYQFQA